ncbi:truncated hemoglobin [Halorientalis pallida]|uniref:truncated hemoglobin n=1 Tax=Halorientalis pallida TaxID=2479928 RepID=UPI00187D5769|nr:hypothetical protein [Halorientalis pallida]
MEATALYDRQGGADGVETVVDEFYDRMLDDEQMRPVSEDVDTEHQRRHRALFSRQVAGGPAEYIDEDLRAVHWDLALTREDPRRSSRPSGRVRTPVVSTRPTLTR